MNKKLSALKTQSKAKEGVIANLKGKLAKNTISDEMKAELEALVAEKESELETLKQMISEAEASDEDKSEELKAKIAEMQKKVAEIENSLKAPKGMIQVKNFIDSKEGRTAFMNVVRNSANGKEFKRNWNEVLTKNGITPDNLMLPATVVSELNDSWNESASDFLQLLNITGLKAIKVAYDDTDRDDEDARAHGHTKGNAKHEQVLNFIPKEIRAQIIYKYITIDRETEIEDENGVLATYIARELSERVMSEIKRAVLVGDGRSALSPEKITKIESVSRSVTDAYVTVDTAAAATPTIEEVAAIVDSIEADGDIHVFMSKKTARALCKFVAASGGSTQYIKISDLAEELGVAGIHTTRYLDNSTSGDPVVVAFVGKAYDIVGDITLQGFEDFVLSYNKKEYLTEVYIGGALAKPKSGAVLLHV